VAPIPISSPAIGSGLEWAVGYMFPFSKDDKVSPKSVLGVGGLFTNNGSRALAMGGRFYLKQDKYRFTFAVGGAKINADIYGVGKLAGDRGLFLPLTATGSAFIVEPLFVRLGKSFHLGARFQYRDLTLKLNREELNLPDGVEPPESLQEIINEVAADLFKQRTIAIGPRFQWDTRDNTYYPRKGIFLDSGIDIFAEAIGSKYTYQYYKFAFNKYAGVGKANVIAFRGMACAAAGDHVPIYDLCLFGSSNDIRGYAAGRYQDRRMFATQAEYRLNIPSQNFIGRFGVVFFGGFGGVAKRFSDMAWGDLLPAGGGGLRFRLTNKDRVNFRIDYGIGRVGHTFTMGVGEAF
jgi:outer membrane protein assembly factor BamA